MELRVTLLDFTHEGWTRVGPLTASAKPLRVGGVAPPPPVPVKLFILPLIVPFIKMLLSRVSGADMLTRCERTDRREGSDADVSGAGTNQECSVCAFAG